MDSIELGQKLLNAMSNGSSINSQNIASVPANNTTTINAIATTNSSNGSVTIEIDGEMVEVDTTVSVVEGDEVVVSISNNTPTVTGVLGGGDRTEQAIADLLLDLSDNILDFSDLAAWSVSLGNENSAADLTYSYAAGRSVGSGVVSISAVASGEKSEGTVLNVRGDEDNEDEDDDGTEDVEQALDGSAITPVTPTATTETFNDNGFDIDFVNPFTLGKGAVFSISGSLVGVDGQITIGGFLEEEEEVQLTGEEDEKDNDAGADSDTAIDGEDDGIIDILSSETEQVVNYYEFGTIDIPDADENGVVTIDEQISFALVKDGAYNLSISIGDSFVAGNVSADISLSLQTKKYIASQGAIADVTNNAVYNEMEEFYNSTSPYELAGGEWSPDNVWEDGKYVWRRTLVTYGSGFSEYRPSENGICISGNTGAQGLDGLQGERGEQGIQGIPGKDGRSSYFHIKYSPVANPTASQMTETPDTYIGTYVDFTEADSNDPTKYIWSRFEGIQGVKGEQGIPGVDGASGKTSYLHIKYSNVANPTLSSQINDTGGDYIGQYTDFTQADSTDPTKYTWSKIKGDPGERGLRGLQGEQGIQGVPGTPGADGKTSYFHIKYSDVSNPTSASQMTENPSTYIGTYVDFTEADSTDPSKYKWSRFEGVQGARGEQGIPGTNGANGKTSYLHIAYANSADGKTGFSVSDSANKLYIGQYTDLVQADSTDPTKYSWTKIKGEQGQQGIQGIPGAAGKGVKTIVNHYLASTASSGVTTNASGWTTSVQQITATKKYLWNYETVTYTDNSTTSTTPCIIGVWGDKGATGATGATGKGIKSIVEHYAVSTSNSTAPTSWQTTVPTLTATNKYLWNYETITYTDNTPVDTAKRVIGVYGDKGDKGATGAQGLSYWRSSGWIDISNTSTYDANKWYPVTGTVLPNTGMARIKVSVQLNSGTKPSWSTHNSGFAVDFDIQTQRSGWGTTPAKTLIYLDNFLWCASGAASPVSYRQMHNSSTPVLFLRGGGKYYVQTDYVCSWTPRTSTYTVSNESVSVQSGRPAPEGKNIEGVGISSVTNHYLATTASSGVTTSTSGWTTTVQSISASKRYLWNYETITYTSGNPTNTAPCIIGVWGDKGATGATGATGKGISSITEYYLASASASGVTTSTSGWTTTMQTTNTTKKYLWNYEKITYTDGSTSNTTVRIIGTHGATGAAGKGVKSTAVTYQAWSNGTSTPTGTWVSTPPATSADKPYLWSRTIITYTDNTTSTTYSVGSTPKGIAVGGRNYILNSAFLSVSGLGSAAGSRAEYQFIKVGKSYMDIPTGTQVTISFDLEMTVNTANPSIQVYNTNNKGPKQISGKMLYFTAPVGSTIKTREHVITAIFDRTDANKDDNFIEFYTIYGTSNWFKISNLKLEIGNMATDWTSAPEDMDVKFSSVSGTCTTPAGTAAKVASLPGFALYKGATVSITFSQANTAVNPTLNVNGTGDKPIKTNGTATAYWSAGAAVLFCYDGASWQVCSSPVYASTVTVGNPAGGNVYIDSDSVDIRTGGTVNSTFTGNNVELGRNSDLSIIKLCDGKAVMATTYGTDFNIASEILNLKTRPGGVTYEQINDMLLEGLNSVNASSGITCDNGINIDASSTIISTDKKYKDGSAFVFANTYTDASAGVNNVQPSLSLGTVWSDEDGSGDGIAVVAQKRSSIGFVDEKITVESYSSSGPGSIIFNGSNGHAYAELPHPSGYTSLGYGSQKNSKNTNIYGSPVNISVNGVLKAFGANRTLATTESYMQESQQINLSQKVSEQPNGIILIWSKYNPSSSSSGNSDWNMTFVPKIFVSKHSGNGVTSLVGTATGATLGAKYVYIFDTYIKGYKTNNSAATDLASGIKRTNNNFVLRYVIGV